MPQPARALAGAACALVLSTTMFTPAAFADDAEGDDATTSRNAISAISLDAIPRAFKVSGVLKFVITEKSSAS